MAQHDFVIANASGSAVRSDLNSCLQAILTNSSGSSAPSTTAAYMFWADSNTGTLKLRNSADNAWVELLQLDGTLTMEDGAVGTPGLAFRGDLDTGLWSSAADTLNISTGGAERAEFASDGLKITGKLNFSAEGASNGIELGIGADLKLYHTGSHSFIENGTGALVLKGDDVNVQNSSGEKLAYFHGDIAELWYNNSKIVETQSNGLKITGNSYGIEFKATSANNSNFIRFSDHDQDDVGRIQYEHSTNEFLFLTAAAAWRARLGSTYFKPESDAAFDLGTSSQRFRDQWVSSQLFIQATSDLVNEGALTADSAGNTVCFRATGAAGHNPLMLWNNTTSGTRNQIQFGDGSSYGSRGEITTNGSNVTYGGTSDYRLKQDDVLITDGITKVKALKPKRFKWKDNLSIGICDGFFAHEIQEVAPTSGATIGTKDAVDSDGNPVYQSVDQAKLVPLLTAAIQEAVSKIEALETKVAALEAA